MSELGRMWGRKIRGCTIAEHGLAGRLGDFHNAKTHRCFPGRDRLCFDLECSKSYVTQLFLSLETKRFIERLRTADGKTRKDPSGDFTSNEFRLNFDRWFPFVSEEIEREQKKMLGYFRRACESPELAQGFHSAWLEKAQDKTDERNNFKKRGKNVRSTRRKSLKPVLWIAIVSESHEAHFHKIKFDALKEIEGDTRISYVIRILRVWLTASD
jgi:hypothetical protein